MSALRFDVDLEWRADQIVGEITVGGVRTAIVQREEATMAGWCTVAVRRPRSTLAAAASIPPGHAGCTMSRGGFITASRPTPSS